MPPLLEMRNISKAFSSVPALKGISFTVQRSEIHALCGENGAGKSTLMKVLSGVHAAGSYDGEIFIEGKERRFRNISDSEAAGIAIIHQELSLVPDMTVAENIFLGREPNVRGWIQQDKMRREAKALLDRLKVNVNIDEKVGVLGMGHQQMVEIAKALSKNAKILVLDEPSSALSEHEVETLLRILKDLQKDGVTSILISHKLNEVFSVADRITILRDGKTISTRDIASTDLPQVVSDMVGREFSDFYPYRPRTIGSEVFEVRGFALHNPETTSNRTLSNISFSVRSGEILGLFGLVGAGRSELLMSLFGASKGEQEGEIFLDGQPIRIASPRKAIELGIGFVTEDRKKYGLVLEDSVRKNITLSILRKISKMGMIQQKKEAEIAEKAVSDFQVKAASIEVATKTLSGGNQQKVVLAKYLLGKPKVLFLDEPTRGIDVNAKAEIYSLLFQLAETGMAIVLVSSELPEVMGICDRMLVLSEGQLTGEFTHTTADQKKIMACATKAY